MASPTAARSCAILVENRVPATFFPNAIYVRWNPSFWRRVAQLGFPVGNHTTHHDIPFTADSYSRMVSEFRSDRRIIEGITGRPMIRVARTPGGALSDRVRARGRGNGLPDPPQLGRLVRGLGQGARGRLPVGPFYYRQPSGGPGGR